ncbi:unnamed protein product, partial [Sphagnum tenellum]
SSKPRDSKTRKLIFDLSQLITFLVAFTITTNCIMRSEANHNSVNPLSCILPLIVSVFIWMMSASYMLLCLAMDNQVIGEEVGQIVKASEADVTDPVDATDSVDPELKTDATDNYENLNNNVMLQELKEISLEDKEEAEETEATAKHNSRDETSSCFLVILMRWIWLLLIERLEYNDPSTYGWRVMFRRMFLLTGITFLTFVTYQLTIDTHTFDSKVEIQKLLVYAGANLTWPEGDSALDDAFNTYNSMQKAKSYIMIMACCCFWASLAFDMANRFSGERKRMFFLTCGRLCNILGSIVVFAGIIILGLPDYLEAVHFDEIFPFCSDDLNATVDQAGEFVIGLVLTGLFTFQLLPVLVMVVPALVRASVLVLLHPALKVVGDLNLENKMVIDSNSKKIVLMQVLKFSSLLAFPVTLIALAIVDQIKKDLIVKELIITFWVAPPLVLFAGLHFYRNRLMLIYYLYMLCYCAPLIALCCYCFAWTKLIEVFERPNSGADFYHRVSRRVLHL